MDRVREILKKMAWPDASIEAYTALVQFGPQSQSDLHARIASGSDPSYTRRAMVHLQKIGALALTDGNPHDGPRRYEAQNPRFVMEKFRDDVDNLMKAALDEAEETWERHSKLKRSIPDKTIHGSNGFSHAVQEAARLSTKRLLVVDPSLVWLTAGARALLKEAQGRVADLRIITSRGETIHKTQLVAAGHAVRGVDRFDTVYVVADDRVIVYQPSQETAVITENPGLARMLAAEFDKLYNEVDGGDASAKIASSATASEGK